MAILFPTLEQISKFKVPPEPGELHLLKFLQNTLSDEYEVYFQVFLNGDYPDIIIMRKNGGVMIIEVKDWQVKKYYYVDPCKNWHLQSNNALIKSPMAQVWKYKDNLYHLHIDELLKQQILNQKLWAVVSCLVYFHREPQGVVEEFCHSDTRVEKGYIKVIGNDALTKQYFLNILSEVKLSAKSYYFSDELYKSFKRYFQPPRHTIEQGKFIDYTGKQQDLIISKKGSQKVIGVAGSGKTVVLAKRAVNAHVRTNSRVLILTFNTTLRNYIHDKVSDVRGDFVWNNFYITHYHQLCVATANNCNLLFENFLADCDSILFFKEAREQIIKYDAVFIDEIQDYKHEWIQIIRKFFLRDDGELVFFGDEKQNIYHRIMDNEKMPNTGIPGAWNKLNTSRRLSLNIVKFAQKMQEYLFKDKYVVDKIETEKQYTIYDYDPNLEQKIDYIFLDTTVSVYEVNDTIIQKIQECNAQPNDVAVLATSIFFLRELEFLYRKKTHEKTSVMFETKEIFEQLKNKFTGKELESHIEKLRRGFKFNFWGNAGTVKFSTIHSFKGWESNTLFLIIENPDSAGNVREINDELIYAGITRCQSNLIIINLGNLKYDKIVKLSLAS